jgi:hypothetical protein
MHDGSQPNFSGTNFRWPRIRSEKWELQRRNGGEMAGGICE